jgi:hypothetical protein
LGVPRIAGEAGNPNVQVSFEDLVVPLPQMSQNKVEQFSVFISNISVVYSAFRTPVE